MNGLDRELSERLATLRSQGLYRELRRVDSAQGRLIAIDGKSLLNFSSNDYLGLANHPALKHAAIASIKQYGAGAGASRLICGSLAPHHLLDETLAKFKGAEAALSFSTGYAAAVGTICALLGTDDIIIVDKLVHACVIDAARLSGAKLRVFRHNDLNHLEQLLRWASAQPRAKTGPSVADKARALVVTESVFSMDGDLAPLNQIVELKHKYGAWLMLDEAHATGLYGAHRRGLAEQLGVAQQIEVQMGTLGKAIGAAGGFISGSRLLIDYLINRARSFIFSTAPIPAAAAAATEGIRIVQSDEGEERRKRLWRLVSEVSSFLSMPSTRLPSAIMPVHIGEEAKAVDSTNALRERGLFIPAIRYPTVARGRARLRLTLTADHTDADLQQLKTNLSELVTAAPGAVSTH